MLGAVRIMSLQKNLENTLFHEKYFMLKPGLATCLCRHWQLISSFYSQLVLILERLQRINDTFCFMKNIITIRGRDGTVNRYLNSSRIQKMLW